MCCASGEMPQAVTLAPQPLWACLSGILVLQAAVRLFTLCVLCRFEHRYACLNQGMLLMCLIGVVPLLCR